MNGPDPLARLRDIHLPEPVSWWPPAPGWWLLFLLVVAMVVTASHFWRRYRRRHLYRKEALQALHRLRNQQAAYHKREMLEEIAMLLRRVAIQTCGRETGAPLVGESWLRFLDRQGDTDQFTTGPGRVLAEGHYRPTAECDLEQLLPLVEKWIGGSRPC